MIDQPENEKLIASDAGIDNKPGLRVVSDRVAESYSTVLKNARQKKGLSVQDIANELKIPLSHLRALEAQEYEKLPADIYATGYIRTYAALLGLNPEGLIKDFRQDKAFKVRGSEERERHHQQMLQEKRAEHDPLVEQKIKAFRLALQLYFRRHWLACVLLIAVVSFLMALLWSSVSRQQAPESYPGIEQVRVESADGTVLVSDIMDMPELTPMVAGSGSVGLGEARLKLMFSGASWVVIRDADDQVIHQSRPQKGEVLEVTGKAPLVLRLSNASVVSLQLNGEYLDFSSHITDDDQLYDFSISAKQR